MTSSPNLPLGAWPNGSAAPPPDSAGCEEPVVLCLAEARRMREIFNKVLSRLPLHFLLAATAAEAQEIARCVHVRLLIIDLNLPADSGWAALNDIRRAAGPVGLRVIALTGNDSPFDHLLAVNVAQVDLFLVQPCDSGELADHVLRLLDLPARMEGFGHAAQDGNGPVFTSA